MMLQDGLLIQAGNNWAQLLCRAGSNLWEAITCDGRHIEVADRDIKPLSADFQSSGIETVLGPKSKPQLVAAAVRDGIVEKGYCIACNLQALSDAQAMQDAVSNLKLVRVPLEFEPYYLGRDSREKTALLDFEDPCLSRSVRTSPLVLVDQLMSDLGDSLKTVLLDAVGVSYENRTDLLVRQTFRDDDEEFSCQHPEATDDETERFMSLMKRKRLCMMQFIGPDEGTLTLIRKDGGAEIDITCIPGRMVIFLTDRFNYSYTCETGVSLSLQCWFLTRAPQFSVQEFGGDTDVLARVEAGAAGPSGETVGVTGLGVYFGAGSGDKATMWLAVNKAGSDTFIEFPSSRFDKDLYYVQCDQMNVAIMQGKSYTRHMGYVDGIELFDSSLFGISNAEAKSMDPNQRKCMECSYLALCGAGYDMKHMKSKAEPIGCFVGISGSEWVHVPHVPDAAGCGGAEAIIANRLNFSLNLKGPSIAMNTACSAGLVALHAGKLHLLYKDYEPLVGCVVGGVQLSLSPNFFIGCCSGGMLSFKGRSFTFDSGADGYGRGEGCAMMMLEIESYTDRCHGMVAGSQSNQDGRSASITAPNGPSQEKCIRAVQREAKISPAEIDVFECHGTGTALGDPIEVGAFKRIYSSAPRSHSLSVCTTKTNYGHSEGAAGAIGFTKCLLQCTHTEASPNLHFRLLNPHIDIEAFPAQFMTETSALHHESAYCGVSSFGFGGTNGHALAYGKNTLSSRSKHKTLDLNRALLRCLQNAGPVKIVKHSDDPEHWESSGMPICGIVKPTMYQVEISEDGTTVWREVVEEAPLTMGRSFDLSGTFNNWSRTSMQESSRIKGLFTVNVTVGETGEELFHILVDGLPDLLIYPQDPQTTQKTSSIQGPEYCTSIGRDKSWCIVGSPGITMKVEFFRSESTRTISWFRA